ncbi:MAG: RnfABCDGE type electron transport complex subunit B [Spirochaetes bacterium]|jgi:Na+-translocating ferredoxin:NAD+ oxidoreductase RNF subunit RnfB|nr:RnfABCDGE type electron transport complex subunit B [Spirochaetota bacterium]
MLDLIFPSIWAVLSLTAFGAIFGLMLSFIKVKLNVEKNPKIAEVLDCLPGANCGACGMPGCSAYATRIVEEKFDINLCPVGGADSAKKIASIMGVDLGDGAAVSMKARVHCQGGRSLTKNRFEYNGPLSCSAASGVMGGFKVCEYGCLGFGDCVRACPFDAMYMDGDSLPVIRWEKCTGCGFCVKACPRNIISLEKQAIEVHVICRNREKAPTMKLGCPVGCIACKLCEKACREVFINEPTVDTAIEVRDFLARIDYDKCINCMKCVEVCPMPVIHPITKSKVYLKKNSEVPA